MQFLLEVDDLRITASRINDNCILRFPPLQGHYQTNKVTWENFKKFSQPYIRIRIAFINGARNRPAEFEKRLRYFIQMTEKNKQFGFGGIEKYY